MSSWLDDVNAERVYRYRSPDNEVAGTAKQLTEFFGTAPKFEPAERIGEYEYAGFDPVRLKQRNEVTYEKNGRVAVRVRDKNGNISHIAKTKLHYMKTGRVESHYTREYEEQMLKSKQEHLLRSDVGTKMGRASAGKAEDMLKDLPDGEYLSDGNTLMPAEPGMGEALEKR